MTCHGFFYASGKAHGPLAEGLGQRSNPRITRRRQGLVGCSQELEISARQRLAQPLQRRLDLAPVGQHRRVTELPAKIPGLG